MEEKKKRGTYEKKSCMNGERPYDDPDFKPIDDGVIIKRIKGRLAQVDSQGNVVRWLTM